MEIIKRNIKVYFQHAMCDCGGEFVHDAANSYRDMFNAMLSGNDIVFEHKCTLCGKVEKFSEQFPRRVEEETDGDA